MKDSVFELTENYLLFSHFWFATPQDVLQADWQEVWHSPQPPLLTVLVISLVSIVLILFMLIPPKINSSVKRSAYFHYYHFITLRGNCQE